MKSYAEKMRITVHNYHSGGSILHPKGRDANGVDIDPESYEVDAWVVGGEDGVFAVYQSLENPKWIEYAQGDDGHWWFAGVLHEAWVPGMIEAFAKTHKEVVEENEQH